jgi:hypothetical protein
MSKPKDDNQEPHQRPGWVFDDKFDYSGLTAKLNAHGYVAVI